MEAIAVSLGVTPYLAGRTTLTLGLLFACYTFKGMWEARELSPRALLLSVTMGVLAVIAQVFVTWARETLTSIEESLRSWTNHVDAVLSAGWAMGVAVLLLGFAEFSGEKSTVGLFGGAFIVLLVGAVAFTYAWLRATFGEFFNLSRLSHEPSVSRTVHTADIGYSVIGVLVAVMFPVVGLVVMVLSLLVLIVAVLLLRAMMRGARGRCEHCAADVHLAASACPSCAAARLPRRLGLFGRVLDGAPSDLAAHRHALLAARRCPACAEPLDSSEACSRCGAATFRDEEARRAFLRFVEARLAALLPAFGVFGLVPVLGIGAAFLLYRLSPAGALSGYIRWRERLGMGLLKSAAVLALIFLQPVPLVGAFAVPAVIALLHASSRRAFLGGAAAEAPASTPAQAVRKLSA